MLPSPLGPCVHLRPELTPYSTPISSALPLDEAADTLPPYSTSGPSSTTGDLPSTAHALFAAALDGELAFLAAHQPFAARCSNNDMLRLLQASPVGSPRCPVCGGTLGRACRAAFCVSRSWRRRSCLPCMRMMSTATGRSA
jgi:hypothetical protein